ncbi:eukaryotic translation initiation factor eIF2A-domain-containing protein [Gigaspora rosea]|uniref:Eukaryotic translation initiation factor 3 subunit B n=1 Tax=Gigaspora rosea TaxID=44941 RepID=A0A397UCD8_9GLOM|nr:eukaryotic translation initiation factor eIF2A-domain-containing protein [Gigaspora rosea]
MPGFDNARQFPQSIEDIDFSDIEEKYKVPFEEGFDAIIVVDNAPTVDESKKDKLLKFIRKIFKNAGNIKDIEMPMDPDPETETLTSKGFLFIEFETPEQAAMAIKQYDGYPMDKTHHLAVNRFTDIEKYSQIEEEYKEPEEEKFVEKEHLRSWLTDPQARDQIVLYRGDDVSIFWNQKTEPPEEVHKRINWTETYVQWSPLGTYLATFHRQGIALWGGPSWNKIIRFVHSGVKLIDFSPNEKYLVTWSNEPITLGPNGGAGTPFGPEDEGRQIIIWDVHGGNLLRSFPSSTLSSDGTPNKITWPMFKWSSSDKYFARVTQGQQGQQGQQVLSVYETPSMGLVGNKSIKIEGLVDFEWAPASDKEKEKDKHSGEKKQREELLSYWTPEIGNQPARVTLLNIPSKEIVRTRNLVNVTDCKMHWQSNGDFLCVKVGRHTKTKKSTFSNLEIFRVREKDIPVEVIEVKDVVIAFAWEPKGERFAIITTSDPNYGQPTQGGVTLKTNVSFYYLEKPKPDKGGPANFKLIKTLEKKSSNAIYWSPQGRHVILATLRSSTIFDLEFWDLDFETTLDQKEFAKADPAACLQLMSTQEHYGVTDVEWDPTGRYVITSSSFWRHSIENGYILWDFKGTQLQRHLLDKFKQLLWRPRPKSLLTSEQKKAIKKNLREYSKKFDDDDDWVKLKLSKGQFEHRRRLMEEWNAWRKRVEKELAEERENAGIVSPSSRRDDDTIEVIEEWIEEVVEETEEIIED